MIRRRWVHDDKERRKWQNPEAILSSIGVKDSAVFVDVGCGEGFFALPAARMVGKSGRVIGIDADEGAIEHLKREAERLKLHHLTAIAGRAEETVPLTNGADLVFFGICFHDFQNPFRVLQNTHSMLKSTGILIDLDWKDEPMALGPPLSKRFSPSYAEELIRSAGFRIRTVQEAGPYHYCITAMPQSRSSVT